MPTTVRPLLLEDRPAWEVLARGYKQFYATTGCMVSVPSLKVS
jgi:hypothetical protein